MSAAFDLDALLDALAERVAAKLREAPSAHYSTDAPPTGVTARAFRDACARGELKASKVGRRWIATAADTHAWIESRRVAPKRVEKAVEMNEPANDAEARMLAALRRAPRRSR